MINRISAGLAACLLLTGFSAQAAVVNGVFTIDSSSLTNLFSTSLGGVCPPSDTGDFFSCVPDSPPFPGISINDVGSSDGSGTLDVDYDDATGEIKVVNNMTIFLPDMDINIAGDTLVEIRNGNDFPTPGLDVTNVVNTGVHADQDASFNTGASITKFQHSTDPATAADFSTFSDIVDLCHDGSREPGSGALCGLIPLLNLDGLRYQIEGTVSGIGGDSLTLTAETSTKSSYTLDFTTAVIPVPGAVWLFGSALGLLGWARRRAA